MTQLSQALLMFRNQGFKWYQIPLLSRRGRGGLTRLSITLAQPPSNSSYLGGEMIALAQPPSNSPYLGGEK